MKKLMVGSAVLALLLGTAPALAHISIRPQGNPPAPGTTSQIVLVVGHGCAGAPTTAIRVQVPEGFYNVKPMPKAGWQVETVTGPYATPFVNHGTELKEGVTEIIWSGGSLPDAFFDEFVFRGTFGAGLEAGSVFSFPTLQMCGDTEDAWIDTSGAEDAEMPAPSVTLGENPEHHHH